MWAFLNSPSASLVSLQDQRQIRWIKQDTIFFPINHPSGKKFVAQTFSHAALASQPTSKTSSSHPVIISAACPLNWVSINKTQAAAARAPAPWSWLPVTGLRYVRKKKRLWSQRSISDGFICLQSICGLRCLCSLGGSPARLKGRP